MSGVKIKYENYLDDPAVRELCLNCTRDDCDGLCNDCKNLVRDILGLPHLREAKPKEGRKKREKRPYQAHKYHEIGGVTHTLNEWAEISDIKYITLYQRMYRYGMTLEEAMTAGRIKPNGFF